MKLPIYLYSIIGLICFMVFSCQSDGPNEESPELNRNITFELYTSQDFSDDYHEIIFKAVIESSKGTIWDSIFTPIKLKEIPNKLNKISFDKKFALVSDCTDCQYRAGFRYEIKDVGISWFFEEINAAQIESLVDFDFQ